MAEEPPAPRIPFRRRSRVVAWAKVLLPLAALALLSTVFLLARAPGGPAEIPFAQIEEIAREPRIDRPRLSGVASDGTTVTLTADRLTPIAARPDAFTLTAPRLDTANPAGGKATLTAGTGEVDGPVSQLRLDGGVRIEATGGYVAEMPGATADLAAGTAASKGEVTAEAPFGELRAGGLGIAQGEEGARLVFNGGVRLLYHPPDPSGPEAPR